MIARIELLVVLAFSWAIAGCGAATAPEPSGVQAPAPETPNPAVEPAPAARFAVPGGDLSTPEWAGRRVDEPFDVKEYLDAWRRKHSDVEHDYLLAMSQFSTEVASSLGESVPKSRLESARAMANLLLELVPSDDRAEARWDEARARRLVALLRPALKEVDAAQRRSECVFSAALQFRQTLPHLQASRALSRIGTVEVRVLDPATDFDAIDRSLNRSFRLSIDVRRRGAMMPQIVGTAIDRLTQHSIHELLSTRSGLTAEQCERLAQVVHAQEVAELDCANECARAEYVLIGNSLWGLERGTLTTEDLDLPALPPKLANAVDYGLEWVALNDMFRFVLREYLPEPYSSVLKRDRYGEKVGALKDSSPVRNGLSAAITGKFSDSVVSVLMAPAFSQFREAVARNEFRLRATRSLALIRRFEVRHRRLPASLTEAFSDAAAGPAPIDPYSGEEVKYRIVGDQVKIYSVGKDQNDDRAELDWDYGRQPGDFILSMPALKWR